MKIRSTIAAAIVSTAALAPFSSRADILSWTYAPSSKDDHGAKTIDGVTITPTYTWKTSASFGYSSGALQIGKTSQNATHVSYSFTGFPGNVVSVAVTAKTVNGNSGNTTLSGTLGGASMTGSASFKSTSSTITLSPASGISSGELFLDIDNPKGDTANSSSQAIYLYSIVVTYDDSSSSGGGDTPVGPVALNTPTDLEAYPITASGFTLSWTGDEHADSYEVNVLDGQGNAAGSVSGSVSPSGTVWTGLLSDTTYKVRVKALAAEGSEEYVESAQSEPLSVTTALAGGLVRATIFEENFTSQDNSWGSSSANLAPLAGGTFNCDESDWTGILVGARRSCAAVGTKEVSGYAQTRSILLANNATSGSASVSFYAVTPTATTSRKVVTVHVFAIDADTGATNWHSSVEAPKLSSTSVTDITAQDGQSLSATVHNLPERFFLRFEPDSAINEKQFAIDAVKVTQVYNPNLTPLAAPVATAGEATMTTLAFSWGAVADATGYAVELRDGSGARVAYDAAVTGTATTFTDLNWNSDYTIRVKALGDDSSSCNSPWSEGVVGHTLENVLAPDWSATAGAGDAVMAVVSNKTFSVSAERDGAPLAVSFDGLSPAAAGTAPTFSAGAFSWTPSAGDEGTTFTATFTTDSGSFSTNIVFGVLARPALVEPAIKTNAVACNAATVSWDSPPQIRAVSYDYRLWSGSDTPTDVDVDQERFHDRVLPAGWVLSGTGWQTSTGYNPTPVKFDDAGDFAVSALYPASVTNLAFTLRKSNGTDSPVVKFYASTGSTNALAWTEVPIELDPGKATKNFQLEFRAADGYRRFKWVYVTKDSNVNLGSVAAKYEGAGVKFKAGSATEYVAAPSGNVLDLTGLRSETNYFLEVRVADESGTKKSATLRFSTLAAPKMTLMVFK